ncbi:MAG: hypothetical protein ACXQTS_01395 [Candidatus Methanospirareceae archaeon]
MVKNGEISVPELQREFVWSDNQANKLKSELEENRNQIRTIVDRARDCIRESIRLLREDMGIVTSSDRYLPTENVLPVMAYYINKRRQLLLLYAILRENNAKDFKTHE